MSYDNFIPTIWSGNFISELQKSLVYAGPGVINRNWEGEIREQGDRVKINQLGPVSVNTYVKGVDITFETLDDASIFLDISESKYFAFEIEDIDAAQAKGSLMQLGMANSAYKMRDSVDQFIAAQYASAGITSGLGTTTTPLTITAKATSGSNTGIEDLLSQISSKLSTANCPKDGRFIILPPAIVQKLTLKVSGNTGLVAQNQAFTNGYVGTAFGFNIYESNNVPNTSGAKYKVIAGHPMAITYAEQINKVVALTREKSFREAVKGLMLYGAKVVYPNCLACATLSTASEA
jgi:hypothetical protein